MNKKLIAQASLLALLSALPLLPGTALAESTYVSSTDTGASLLDFIENRRRARLANRLTEEQQALVKATAEMRQHLRHPVDATKAVPTSFEGDELTYDQNTGEFVAKGKVHIVQLDGHQFDAVDGLVTGNTVKQEISVPGESRMLQLTPGQPRVTLDGFDTYYRYGERTGTMGEAKGKVDHQYVTGKKFEFYPDKIIVYDGTTTKCGAKNPDYHLSGDKITIYPNDKMIIENAKYWLKNVVLFTRKRYEQRLEPGAKQNKHLPTVGYSKSEGAWISYDIPFYLGLGVSGHAYMYANTKKGLKPRGTLNYSLGRSNFELAYGYYKDGDDRWLKREPSLVYTYNAPVGYRTHLHYYLKSELGRWRRDPGNITSMHRYYYAGLSRDPIPLGKSWWLNLSAGYSITQETYNGSTVKGYNWSASTVKEFDDHWAVYGRYAYSVANSKNSLFDYDLDSFSRKVDTGFSYRLNDKDRFVVGWRFDMDSHTLDDVDYYWFHDMHCSQFILRYRGKRKTWSVTWDFLPW